MKDSSQILTVSNFQDLASTPFKGEVNALCWKRELVGNFSEIVQKIELAENMMVLEQELLHNLDLSEQGNLAREILLKDMKLLKDHGASPVLNVIKSYERDEDYPFFPTDVYSFHVDRSPVPTNTFLCTYHGESSEILPNSHGVQKVLVPEIRDELKKLYGGAEDGFESYLEEYFFDLHYQAKANAEIISSGNGNLWKLAVDHPESDVLPCLHRAPKEIDGELRLMVIC